MTIVILVLLALSTFFLGLLVSWKEEERRKEVAEATYMLKQHINQLGICKFEMRLYVSSVERGKPEDNDYLTALWEKINHANAEANRLERFLFGENRTDFNAMSDEDED